MTGVGPAVRVERKLRSFGGLVRGWHYGEGEPIAAETVRLARRLHLFSVALGFTNMDAFPCVNGEVLLTIYADRYLEILVEPCGRVWLFVEDECLHGDPVAVERMLERVLTRGY